MSEPAEAAGGAALADDAPHVLFVDDDRRIRDLLSRVLRKEGYRVTLAASAEEARVRMRGLAFDLLVLDMMMPGENGLDLATAIRVDSDVPILMLTARAETKDRVAGLEAGVDDYLAKPFEVRELSLRIASILRRAAPRVAPVTRAAAVRFGPFTYRDDRGELKRDDEVIRLTDREREMLGILAEAAGGTVTREALAGQGAGANERTVDVQVNRLRRKIERDPANPLLLQTVRGSGYRLMVEP